MVDHYPTLLPNTLYYWNMSAVFGGVDHCDPGGCDWFVDFVMDR